MKLYRYRYSHEYLQHAGLTTQDFEDEDTGVLAQEMKEVLPEAVKESVSATPCCNFALLLYCGRMMARFMGRDYLCNIKSDRALHITFYSVNSV